MKSTKLFFLLFLVLFFSVSIFAQDIILGKVTQVIDGRTVLITTAAGKTITCQMPDIEVPESDQPLHQIVIDHLGQLVLNKNVKFVSETTFSKGALGRLYLDETDIGQQMLRDGAAWFNLPERANSSASQSYQETEALAKNEKRGIWGIDGIKPAWEFRKEQFAKKLESEKLAKTQQSKIQYKISYPTLPEKIQNTNFIDVNAAVPKGFIVIGVGYLEKDKEKLIKIVKKPQSGDLACNGYEIPRPFVITGNSISNICPSVSFGNNASSVEDGAQLANAYASDAHSKTLTAYRMYKISGNNDEFEIKLESAVDAVNKAAPMLPENDFKNYLLLSIEALKDCLIVKKARTTTYYSGLSGSVLLELNNKYGLNDVSEYRLDDEIFKVGVGYMNQTTAEAKKLGIR